ncbi:sensor histidine kinase [Arthrobacter sp. UYP6]|uniref:sensor histidine kinase n=1 Tax=Arthrobacter sp. UYP6 TaxID=1756378 RepID=UPI0033981541
MSLASQYLGLQSLIVFAVFVAVLALSITQSAASTLRTESRKALSAAESMASMPAVRTLLPNAHPRVGAALPSVAESVRSVSGARSAILASPNRRILTSPDPAEIDTVLDLGSSDVLSGRSWTGLTETAGRTFVSAHVPILGDDGEIVGISAVSMEYPSVVERLSIATPTLLIYLAVAGVLGTVGSLLLAARVKRQTLGLEPQEITSLVEHREAMLHGVKEGVLALDMQNRITLANDGAYRMLSLPPGSVGRTLADMEIEPILQDVLTREQVGTDRLVLVNDRVLVFNRKPLSSRGSQLGSVTTMRDRTELSYLEAELGITRTITETLRAQTHEFANQLHTISGLIQLREFDDVVTYVNGVSSSRSSLHQGITSCIGDPTLAALLIAKTSLAAERGVSLQLNSESRMGRADENLTLDLTTVVGNLVDNAIDAAAGGTEAQVHVTITEDTAGLNILVRDTGPGVSTEMSRNIFRQGFSTKDAKGAGGRGFGLALTRLTCMRRGGDVKVWNDGGAVFAARLPAPVEQPVREGTSK